MSDTPATDAELAALQALASDVSTTTHANATSAAAAISVWQADPSSTVGIPKLPPGTTLDLTHPTINVPSVGEFTIPAILSVPSGGSEPIAPHSLKTEDWIVIARNNNLLRAYTLGAPNERDDPPRATELALDYMVPENTAFIVDKHLESTVRHEVTYSSATASYVRAGFDKQSAGLSIPYVAASIERQHKEREAHASSSKTIYVFGSWYYPRALLHLKMFTKPSTRLTTKIEAAVNANDADALKQVFDKYGWAAPEDVEIGGQLFLIHKEVCGASVNETQVEDTIEAAVNAKYYGVAADASIGFGNASGTKVTAEQVNKLTTFHAAGGKATLVTNPQLWPDSVNDPNNWAVIGVSGLAPITEWLEPDLKAKVERLLPEMGIPALQVPQDISAEDHSARADSDGFIFGTRLGYAKGIRGGLQFVCGTSGSPALGQTDAVGGSATFHSSRPRDIWRDDPTTNIAGRKIPWPVAGEDCWIDGASICLPVPKRSHYSVKKWDYLYPHEVGAASRFQRAETQLTFGKWQTLFDRTGFTSASQLRAFTSGAQETDGFIFCSVRAPGVGDRGVVWCTVDGKILGAASVHNAPTPSQGCWSPDACFCVPFPRHLPMTIDAGASSGKLDIKVWHLASTSRDWKFGRPELYALNASHPAETDGFLNGVVTVRKGNAKGELLLYCGPDLDNIASQNVIPLMMAVHQTVNRFIPYASAMLPVRRGFFFRPVPWDLSQDPGHSPATVEAYWTPLHPVA
jgi:hypothetical protein